MGFIKNHSFLTWYLDFLISRVLEKIIFKRLDEEVFNHFTIKIYFYYTVVTKCEFYDSELQDLDCLFDVEYVKSFSDCLTMFEKMYITYFWEIHKSICLLLKLFKYFIFYIISFFVFFKIVKINAVRVLYSIGQQI